MSKYIGFTIIEILVSLAILLSLIAIGVPSLNNFIVRMRVENEIYAIHRMLSLARNSALNLNSNVTLCPLNNKNQCINAWHNELTVFTDKNNNKVFEPTKAEQLIAIKSPIHHRDKLQYGTRKGLTYENTGRLHGWGQNATFKYCPFQHLDKSRAITVSLSGRVKQSQYNSKLKKEKTHSGRDIICV